MFYALAQEVQSLNLFRYISFRTGAALMTSLAIYLVFGQRFIGFVKTRFAQPIRKEGPGTHLAKQGTPTMGGLLIVAGALASSLLWCNLKNGYVWLSLAVMASFGLIGFADDFVKIRRGDAYRGLSGRLRLALQFAIGLAVSYGVASLAPAGLKTALAVPFFKNMVFDLGLFFFVFASVTIVATANAYNLTDGVDGLAAITGTSAFLVFMVVSYLAGRADFSLYLLLPYVPGAGEVCVFIGAVLGAILGFLWFNAYPAGIFMGDVGSLAIGGALGVASVIVKHELLLAIAGGIFVVEALSVMIQVGSRKLRGKRVFKMAPIHHHFELKGWSEQTVVIRFWIISILLALLALSSIKVR
ncbi:MAG: phospho-N-acetylmuramoyl-pentapeptide-transferase [Rickettsiales bacterium]|jgi:phospho-N-acetylmuramoyl-pentapeptide-transferase|nr:phospho-N-acetylmuramoyl-pentapeptide-transferase [Rickettsiales bacterium]